MSRQYIKNIVCSFCSNNTGKVTYTFCIFTFESDHVCLFCSFKRCKGVFIWFRLFNIFQENFEVVKLKIERLWEWCSGFHSFSYHSSCNVSHILLHDFLILRILQISIHNTNLTQKITETEKETKKTDFDFWSFRWFFY